MYSKFFCVLMVLATSVICLSPQSAEAQIGRRVVGRLEARGRNIVARIRERRQARLGAEAAEPGATPSDPKNSEPAATPDLAEPQVEIQQATALEPSAPPFSPAHSVPSAAQLVAMNDVVLLDYWRTITKQFQQELGTLTTAAGWQRHFAVSEDVLAQQGSLPSEFQTSELQKLLSKFEKVAANPAYEKISNQPSFEANHIALQEIVTRFGGPHLGSPADGEVTKQIESKEQSTQEILPTPSSVAEEPQKPQGERSILKRR